MQNVAHHTADASGERPPPARATDPHRARALLAAEALLLKQAILNARGDVADIKVSHPENKRSSMCRRALDCLEERLAVSFESAERLHAELAQ